MAKKTVHHLDFETLVYVNRTVVALTKEAHSYSESDGLKLSALVKEVEGRADNVSPDEAIPDKAALLMFKLATGQYFQAGNKRTSLVSGAAFLQKNGFSLKIRDAPLVEVIDRAGVGAATLDDVFATVGAHVAKGKTDRKGWEGVVDAIVDASREYLIGLAA